MDFREIGSGSREGQERKGRDCTGRKREGVRPDVKIHITPYIYG